ncbi:MAG: nitric oxide reductase activation protein NorD, partial [Clostridia bacterium]|nr:nitric oxide reductase activation protein NorD [Clostridia bacterium]
MARVNHKLVKQRLNEKRSKITDRQFFTSRLLAGHFEDMAAAQTRRYKYNRRVHVNLVWEPDSGLTAMTNNRSIIINCGHKFITKVRGRENRYQVICGFFAHELGHVLYTDFLADQTQINMLGQGKWFPEKPILKTNADIRNEAALWDYANDSEENMQAVQYVASEISNVIEDGYIEDRMLLNFPGTLRYGLESLREIHFEQMPTVTQLIEQEDDGKRHLFESILQNILSYVKFGEIKYGDEPLSDLRIKTVFDLISDIDSALMSNSAKDR